MVPDSWLMPLHYQLDAQASGLTVLELQSHAKLEKARDSLAGASSWYASHSLALRAGSQAESLHFSPFTLAAF